MGAKVLIADDHGIIRQGLRSYLESQLGMKVVAEAQSGRVVMGFVRKFKPDIVIMDVTIPDLDGVVITNEILAEFPDVKIVALSANCYVDFTKELFEAGICAYVLKGTLFEELPAMMKKVLNGERYLSFEVEGVVIDSVS